MPKPKQDKSTEQLNIRMPKELLEDLEQISSILKVNKSEWIKIKLGELVYEEKSKLLKRYSDLKESGITSEEIKRLLK